MFDHSDFAYVSHGKVITRVKLDPSTGRPAGRPEVWAETGGPNGHKVLADGTHLVCDHSRRAVLKLDASGRVLGAAAAACDGANLRAPNDLTLDTPNGGFYFTDPGGSAEQAIGTVHYVARDGAVTRVAGGLRFPNGLALAPDGRRLYVAETTTNRVWAYPVLGAGRLGEGAVFADLPKKADGQIDNLPDGVCVDAAGNLYVAHWGMRQVQILSPDGKVVRRLAAGNLTASNVAFGPDRKTLYVSGGREGEDGEGGLFRVPVFDRPDGLFVLPPAGR